MRCQKIKKIKLIISINQRRNKIPRGGRGGRGGHGTRDQQNKNTFQGKKYFERKFKEENRKELPLYKKEAKDSKEFKVKLGGDDTEKFNRNVEQYGLSLEFVIVFVRNFKLLGVAITPSKLKLPSKYCQLN